MTSICHLCRRQLWTNDRTACSLYVALVERSTKKGSLFGSRRGARDRVLNLNAELLGVYPAVRSTKSLLVVGVQEVRLDRSVLGGGIGIENDKRPLASLAMNRLTTTPLRTATSNLSV
jgi:hypothetical protein